MASAGSLEPLGRYGVAGLPTVTLLSAENALASVGTARAAVTASNATKIAERRIIVGYLPYVVLCKDPGQHSPRKRQSPGPRRCPYRESVAPDCHGVAVSVLWPSPPCDRNGGQAVLYQVGITDRIAIRHVSTCSNPAGGAA